MVATGLSKSKPRMEGLPWAEVLSFHLKITLSQSGIVTWRIQKPPGGPRVLLLEIFPSPFLVVKYIQQKVSNVNIFKCFLEVLNIIKCGTTIAALGSEVLSFYRGFCGLNSGPQVGQQESFFPLRHLTSPCLQYF